MKNWLIVLSLITLTLGFLTIQVLDPPSLRVSASPIQFTPHTPIIINGNDEFAALVELEQWQGIGSVENPYILEKLDISGTTNGSVISINNTHVHFQIKNCLLNNGEIKFNQVNNGQIFENNLTNTTIYLYRSDYNVLSKNMITNGQEGIWLGISSDHNIINENNIHNMRGRGIYVGGSENNFLEKNIVDNSNKDGIVIIGDEFYEEKKTGANNYLINNTSRNNGGRGIVVGDWSWCSDCGGHPYYSYNCTLIKNVVTNNTEAG
ncbi:MAG: right-handed parallel beta-helix repeat-containing protein, partial [Candidatus Hodarchaeales archaeon]